MNTDFKADRNGDEPPRSDALRQAITDLERAMRDALDSQRVLGDLQYRPGQLYLAVERNRKLSARRVVDGVDLDAGRFEREQAAFQSDHRGDERGRSSFFVQLTVAGRRVADLFQKRTGDDGFGGQAIDRLIRLVDRVRHWFAPSSLAGTGSVGRSAAQDSASSAADRGQGGTA